MPRSPAQSDFVIASEPVVVVKLPEASRPIELPMMVIRTTQAGEFATRWVMRFVLLSFVIFALLCVLGHIPSGE